MSRINEIQERRKKLSSLPWEYKHEMTYDGMWLKERWIDGPGIISNFTDDTSEGQEANADCEFIVNAPYDVEYLLGELERLRGVLQQAYDYRPADHEDMSDAYQSVKYIIGTELKNAAK